MKYCIRGEVSVTESGVQFVRVGDASLGSWG